MAACVVVANGPDAGWRYVVRAGEVRIGRGAGHQVKVSDPAWGEGHLRVQFRGGGYLVTNLMPHPVYLDGKPLATGERRTWYAGTGLQPTADTLIRLEVTEADAGPAPGSAVVAEPPARDAARPPHWVRDAAAAGLVVVALAAVGYKELARTAPPTPAAEFTTRVAPALAEAANRPGPDAARAGAVRRAVQAAVFVQSEGRLDEAKQRYREARRVIEAARQALGPKPDPAAAAAVAAAHAFVARQLQNP